MSVKTETTYYCDLCNGEIADYSEGNNRFTLPVRFMTEQTEGRPTEPYYQRGVTLDLCNDCATKAIRINAWGAMGYNEYRFSKKEV